MTVPPWSEVVRASEFVPGQPVTADLLNRMYGNIFATFALDPDQATVPVFSLPPSGSIVLAAKSFGYITKNAVNTSYATVGTPSGVSEYVEISGGATFVNTTNGFFTASNCNQLGHYIYQNLGGDTSYAVGTIKSIHVTYSSSVPTGVVITSTVRARDSSSTITITDYSDTIPLSNTATSAVNGMESAKAYADSAGTYLLLQNAECDVVLKAWKNKADT